MVNAFPQMPSTTRALLCLDAQAAKVATSARLAGKSLIFHQINQLQRLGCSSVCVVVETVPADLPALIDSFRQRGLQIALSRGGEDLVKYAHDPGRILVIDGSIWVSDNSLAQMVQSATPLVAVVPQETAPDVFERIDLNRRWAGVAVIDPGLLARCGDLPDGWSLASYVMRTAIQAGYDDIEFATTVGAANIFHLASADVERLARVIRPSSAAAGKIEAVLFAAADWTIARQGSSNWYRSAALYSSMTLAFFALFAALFGFLSFGYVILLASSVALVWRRHMRWVDYRHEQSDPVSIGIAATLAVALFVLMLQQTPIGDAIFLILLGCGLLMLRQRTKPSRILIELSPVLVITMVTIGYFAGYAVMAVKFAIIAMLAALLVPSRLKPH